MKRNIKLLFTMLLSSFSILSYSQDFTITMQDTDYYQGYLIPLKANDTYTQTIGLKNNTSLTTAITVVPLGTLADISWDAIVTPVGTFNILAGQTISIKVEFTVPSYAQNGSYTYCYYFNATDANDDEFTFSSNFQYITVDNTPPLQPVITYNTTSYKVNVINFSSWDGESIYYNNLNENIGKDGIKSYKVYLKQGSSIIGGPVTIDAIDSHSYSFSSLNSNTIYVIGVTGIDLAGNSSTTEVNVTTAPAPPTISSSAQSFCNITLNWTASSGATTYKLYNATTSTTVLLTTTSDTSFIVSGLTSGTTYKFYVKAYNSTGLGSDAGNTLSVSTLTVPTPSITGSNPVCTSGTTFTVSNKPDACSLTWVAGPSLTLYSTNGNSAIFKSTGNYANSWIKAIYDSGCGTSEYAYSVDAGTPTPGLITILWDVPPRRFSAFITPIVSATSYKWYLDGVLKFDSPEYDVIFARQIWNCEHIYDVDVVAVNSCGVSALRHTEVIEDPCDYSFKIYPNPASTEITISQSDLNTKSSAIENVKEAKSIETVKIIDNFGNVFFEKRYSSETKEVKIHISNLKKGTYFVILNNEDPEHEVYTILKN